MEKVNPGPPGPLVGGRSLSLSGYLISTAFFILTFGGRIFKFWGLFNVVVAALVATLAFSFETQLFFFFFPSIKPELKGSP